MRFTVVLPDYSREEWGVEADAAYEVERSGHLRIIEFDPLPNGLHDARTAKVYAEDACVDIRREFVGFVWQDDSWDRTGVLLEAADNSEARAILQSVYGDGSGISVWNEDDAAQPR